MNNGVQKIKENIIRECHSHQWCRDCPYSDDEECSVKSVFDNRDEHFTTKTIFFKLFKKAIIKECKTTEDCESCVRRVTCRYHDLPLFWR